MNQILFSLGLIASGLASGYVIQVLVQQGVLRLPGSLESIRKGLQKTALLFLNPIAIVGAVWIVDIGHLRLAALPVIGLSALLLGGILALLAARALRLDAHRTGALFPCGSFTNIGSIGALVCFVFLGEAGFALLPIYKLFEEITYYAVGFPIAKYYSGAADTDRAASARLRGLAKDPFILVAVSSLLLGGVLNFSGIARPPLYAPVNAVIIPLATVMLLTSIGLAMRFRSVRHYLRECLAVATIKFVLVPAAATSTAWLLGFGDVDGGIPLKVVLILSSMPVAFNALIPPSIYDLDLDLANACWFFTTAGLIVVLPILNLLIGWI